MRIMLRAMDAPWWTKSTKSLIMGSRIWWKPIRGFYSQIGRLILMQNLQFETAEIEMSL
jgi:hypothetical protein